MPTLWSIRPKRKKRFFIAIFDCIEKIPPRDPQEENMTTDDEPTREELLRRDVSFVAANAALHAIIETLRVTVEGCKIQTSENTQTRSTTHLHSLFNLRRRQGVSYKPLPNGLGPTITTYPTKIARPFTIKKIESITSQDRTHNIKLQNAI